MKTKMMFQIGALGFSLFTIGCATTGHGSGYSDAEVEMAMHRTEDETLARLAASNNTDIADAAGTLARERATR
ncbi:MAG TPA: hypothetical protein VH853_06550 [Polyangia bacterium]|jgi:hypothetical protein|nr:hypothetical protein [Polyangia bacterium]